LGDTEVDPLEKVARGGAGFFACPVNGGNPFRYGDVPLVRALGESWIEHLTTNCRGALPDTSLSHQGYTVFYGRISTIVPFGANLAISSISSFVTAIHPFVQSISA